MTDTRVRASLAALIRQLRTYVPMMAPYFDTGTALGDYSATLRPTTLHPVHRARQEAVARAARAVAARTFGSGAPVIDTADLAAVNIVDHHQLLNHPLLLGTNVIANAARLRGEAGGRPIVTFSCSNIAPANYYLRNGFQFRGQPVAYFAAKEYQDVMYYVGHRAFDFVERLQRNRRWQTFTVPDQEFLIEYQRLLNGLDYYHCPGHKEQIAMAVRATWPMLFQDSVPELLYVNAEEVARYLMIEMLAGQGHLVEVLLDRGWRRDVLDSFRGIVVAWDEAAGKGTHFFWRRYPDRPRLLRLYVEGDQLVPADPRFRHLSVPLERAALLDHLHRDEIVPAVSLQVSLFLHAGIRPLVGPGSLVYVTKFRDGWASLLARHGLTDEAELVRGIDAGGLIAGTPIFFARDGDRLRTLYAAEVMCAGGVGANYLDSVLKAPLADLLSVGASGIYDLFAGSYIPEAERLEDRVGFDDAATVMHEWI
jgi:hypothetical protein